LPYPCSLQPTYAVAPAVWQKVRHPEDPGQPTNHTAETLGHMLKEPTHIQAHLVFADTQSQIKKPKELEFNQRKKTIRK